MERKFLFGLDEVSSELNKGYDKGLKNSNIAYFAKLLKVKTLRVWLNLHEIVKVIENDKVVLLEDGVSRLNDYLSTMKDAGVERFSLLFWGYVYPFGYQASDKFTIPDPNNEPTIYERFLNLLENVVFEIAKKFPDIGFFEPTNEPEDGQSNFHKNLLVFDINQKAFDSETVKRIVLDLCGFTSRGAKKGNKNAKLLMPGFMNIATTPAYLDSLYCAIESGEFPSFGPKSNKIDDFFDVMNWHPYNLKDSDINDYWFSTIDGIRAVMEKHGDLNRTIWFNEVGWSDLRRETEMVAVAKRYNDLLKAIKEKLPFVETVFPFRLFSLATKPESEGEDNFGLVFNEYDWDTPLYPKPAFIELYKGINGQDADLEPCYKLAKVKNREVFRSKTEGDGSYKVLFIGNAITYRKEAPWCDFYEGKGLGASTVKNDYAHQVIESLRKIHGNISATFVDAVAYEKTFFDENVFNELVKFADINPDLTVVFIGDNYGNFSLTDHNVGQFYSKLLKALKDKSKKVICVSPFDAADETLGRLCAAAKENDIEMVDVTKIKDDKTLLFEDGYINKLYKIIPNDDGHRLIASKIIEKL